MNHQIDPGVSLAMLTAGVVPPAHAERVSAWAYNQNWRVGGLDLTSARLEEIDHEHAGRAIYDHFRRAHNQEEIYKPSNLKRLLDAVAVKLYCESYAALEQADPGLAEKLYLAAIRWLDWRENYLVNQHIPETDWAKLINTFVSRTVKSEGFMSELQHERRERRKAQGKPTRATDAKTYTHDELKAAALSELKRDRLAEYTSANLAEKLECRSQYREVGRVLGELAKEPSTGVVWWHPRGQPRMILWKWCPERHQMKAAPEKADQIVRKWVLYYVKKKQEKDVSMRSKTAIRDAMRDFFGPIDNAVVDKAIGDLIKSEELVVVKGNKGRQAYQLPVVNSD